MWHYLTGIAVIFEFINLYVFYIIFYIKQNSKNYFKNATFHFSKRLKMSLIDKLRKEIYFYYYNEILSANIQKRLTYSLNFQIS